MLEPQVSEGCAVTIRTKQKKVLENGKAQPRAKLTRILDNERVDQTRFFGIDNPDNQDNVVYLLQETKPSVENKGEWGS